VVIGLAFAGFCAWTFGAQAACSNPSPLPSGYASPCPVFAVSPASVAQTGTLTLSATPQAGTDYIYTTVYYAQGSTWTPVTLAGNSAAPSYSSGPASGALSAAILSTLPIGTNYVVLWDWLWDSTAGCYKGPGLNQCNTGTWRLQTFGLTQFTSGPAVSISPTTLTFPSTQVGVTSAPQSFTIINIGTVTLTLGTNNTVSGDFNFGGVGTCATSLAVGASCTYSANFTPTAIGTRTGTEVIFNSAPNSPQTVTLTGTGVSSGVTPTPSPTGCTSGCANYYISTSGSDANSCTQASPCQTINSVDGRLGGALPLGSGGTIIHVLPGTYTGPITTNRSGTASARIVWLSDTKWGAKVSNADWQINGAYSDVAGFDLTSQTGWCTGISHNSVPLPHDIHILNNYCHDVSVGTQCRIGGAMWVGGTQPSSPTTPPPVTGTWYIGNVLRHIGNPSGNTAGGTCWLMSGIYSHGGHELIYNNIISGAAGWAVTLDGPTGIGNNLPSVISNNTFFNNGGGIGNNQCGDNACGLADYLTITNNIIVNNGLNTVYPSVPQHGLGFDHISGSHWLVSNNLIYGNLASDLDRNYGTCGTSASGSTPSHGVAITQGLENGCPDDNAQTDAGGTGATFVNFQSDYNQAPASNYNPANYQLKSGSNAINQGTTQCASAPGLTPCTPTTDFSGKTRPNPPSIGAYEQ
jgi:hypothetical protein